MPKHIGIAACSAPGAALCYQTICTEAPQRMGAHAHPEVSLHAFSFAEHVRRMEAGDWDGVGRLMADSARKLAAIGADFAICPDNTGHQGMDAATAGSPIPWLHIAEVVAREAARIGARRVAVLGTRWLMEGPVYPARLEAAGVEWRTPGPERRRVVDRIIFDHLVFGRVPEEARAALREIIAELHRDAGCDAVVLGCTELPLAVTDGVSDVPTLDSTRLLARAALAEALDGERPSPD